MNADPEISREFSRMNTNTAKQQGMNCFAFFALIRGQVFLSAQIAA
jgi:hypothetical protein